MCAVRSLVALAALAAPLPARAAEKDIETKLPAQAENVHVADGGKYLVLKLRGFRGLHVYTAATQKLTAIDLPDDDFAYGAGGDTAVVFVRDKNELRAYDVKTGKLVKSKEFVDQPIITGFVMGHSRGDLALVHMGRNPVTGGFQPSTFLDVAELRMKPAKPPLPIGQRFNFDGVQLRANGDLSRVTEWATAVTPNGIGLYSKSADGGYAYLFAHDSSGTLIPGDDGRIYTGFGTVLTAEPGAPQTPHNPFRRTEPVKGRSLYPAIGGQFVVGLTRGGGMALYMSRGLDSVCRLDDFPSWDGANKNNPNGNPGFNPGFNPNGNDFGPGANTSDHNSQLTLDKRICFAPALGHILFLPQGNDKIVHRTFDLKSVLDQTGEHYLLMTSLPPSKGKGGAVWEHRLQAIAKHEPVKYELVRAPEGMTVTAEGRLAWTPQKGVIGRAPVEVKVTDAKDKVVTQTFEINFD